MMADANDDNNDNDMPVPPDLTSLFQKQTQQINDACEKASQAFSVFKTRDSDVASLTQSLNSEVNEVFMMAKAAKTPQLAMATIPRLQKCRSLTRRLSVKFSRHLPRLVNNSALERQADFDPQAACWRLSK